MKRALHDRGMALITFYLDVKILDIRYELVAFWKSKYILYNAGTHLVAIIYEQKSLKLCRMFAKPATFYNLLAFINHVNIIGNHVVQ